MQFIKLYFHSVDKYFIFFYICGYNGRQMCSAIQCTNSTNATATV